MLDTPPKNGGSRPVPDPTLLTTEQIKNAIAALHEIVTTRIDGQEEKFESRLDGMDKAVVLLQTNIDKGPAHTSAKVKHLKELFDEKFRGVKKQFVERDTRVTTSAKAAADALSAALQAAKEAVGEANKSFSLSIDKSEKATGEQLKGLGDQIADLKERVTRTEAEQRAGVAALATATSTRSENHGSVQWLIGLAVLAFFQLIGIALTIGHLMFGVGK